MGDDSIGRDPILVARLHDKLRGELRVRAVREGRSLGRRGPPGCTLVIDEGRGDLEDPVGSSRLVRSDPGECVDRDAGGCRSTFGW